MVADFCTFIALFYLIGTGVSHCGVYGQDRTLDRAPEHTADPQLCMCFSLNPLFQDPQLKISES